MKCIHVALESVNANQHTRSQLTTLISFGYTEGGGSRNKSGAADLPRRPLAGEFLRGAIVPANAYKFVKFELPSAISFGDMEGVPK